MKNFFNIYCDESCHLQNDSSNIMGFGALCIPENIKKELSLSIQNLAASFGYSKFYEYKWTKISPCNVELYEELVDLFFNFDEIQFRVWLVENKKILKSLDKNQFDNFYYKMYFYLLNYFIKNQNSYNIYLDYKDTHGGDRVHRLKRILSTIHYDYYNRIVKRIQLVESKQSSLIQLCDVILGAVTCCNRGIETSCAKQKIINKIKDRTNLSLVNKTGLNNRFNIFIMEPNRRNLDGMF